MLSADPEEARKKEQLRPATAEGGGGLIKKTHRTRRTMAGRRAGAIDWQRRFVIGAAPAEEVRRQKISVHTGLVPSRQNWGSPRGGKFTAASERVRTAPSFWRAPLPHVRLLNCSVRAQKSLKTI